MAFAPVLLHAGYEFSFLFVAWQGNVAVFGVGPEWSSLILFGKGIVCTNFL